MESITLLAVVAVVVYFFKKSLSDVGHIASNTTGYGVARTNHLPEFGALEAELDIMEKKHEIEQRKRAIEALTKPTME